MSERTAIRLVSARTAEPMAYDDAEAAFRVEFAAAKVALAEVMAMPAHFHLRKMLDGSALTIRDMRQMRAVAAEMVGKAHAMVHALDLCIDVAERAERGAR